MNRCSPYFYIPLQISQFRRERENTVFSRLYIPSTMKKKLKPLLPSLKERQRYIVFEVLAEHEFPFATVSKGIWDSMIELIGINGTSDAGLQVLSETYNNNKGIMRVNHTHVQEAKATLAWIHSLHNQPVIAKSVSVSGILKKAKLR
jgi:ribonuclease P/MRP protein subunit POP5